MNNIDVETLFDQVVDPGSMIVEKALHEGYLSHTEAFISRKIINSECWMRVWRKSSRSNEKCQNKTYLKSRDRADPLFMLGGGGAAPAPPCWPAFGWRAISSASPFQSLKQK